MTIIAFISQKGGVGKSTLAQALASEAKKKKISVLLADCDSQQATSYEWSKLNKKIPCQVFNSVSEVWPLSKDYDLIIIDGPARTSAGTLEIAKKADLLIQPTGASRADLIPAIKEFNALKKAGIPTKKLLFVLTRLSTPAEAKAVQEYLTTKTEYSYSPDYLMEKASYKQIQNEGKSVIETKYPNLAKQARQVINSLLEHL